MKCDILQCIISTPEQNLGFSKNACFHTPFSTKKNVFLISKNFVFMTHFSIFCLLCVVCVHVGEHNLRLMQDHQLATKSFLMLLWHNCCHRFIKAMIFSNNSTNLELLEYVYSKVIFQPRDNNPHKFIILSRPDYRKRCLKSYC